MLRIPVLGFILALLISSNSQGQTDAPVTPRATSAAPTQTPSVEPNVVEAKKSKKVWTNDNLSEANGSISVVGAPKSATKSPAKPGKPVDAKYIADTKKQLAKLEGQQSDIDKEIAQLKAFSQGETGLTAGGAKVDKSINRDPIDVQIRELGDKKKLLQQQIDALLDEARKKGVEPGQLR